MWKAFLNFLGFIINSLTPLTSQTNLNQIWIDHTPPFQFLVEDGCIAISDQDHIWNETLDL